MVSAGQNITNLEACYQAFAYVMSNTEHTVYPASFGPSITSPVLIWLTLTMVVGFEFLAGLLAARGAWDMWSARSAQASPFNASKKYALLEQHPRQALFSTWFRVRLFLSSSPWKMIEIITKLIQLIQDTHDSKR